MPIDPLAGIYLVLKTELRHAYDRYTSTTFDIYDHPSVLVLKQIIPGQDAQIEWARRVIPIFWDVLQHPNATVLVC